MPTESLPDIGLGTYRNTDPDECAHAVAYALERGYRHVDTAEGYDNEAYVGEGIDAAPVDREDVFLATKVSPDNLAGDDVLDHARASRDRLGVDVVDLLYVHWPLGAYDHAETLAAFERLREEGVIRHVGLSNFTPDLLEAALSHLDVPLFAHQVEMHPLLPQETLHEYAVARDHYLVAYAPIARGAVDDVPELRAVAEKHDATPAQVSLAWLADKENVVAIPKAASEAHIRENLAATELSLDDEDVRRIESIDRTRRVVDFEAAPWNA